MLWGCNGDGIEDGDGLLGVCETFAGNGWRCHMFSGRRFGRGDRLEGAFLLSQGGEGIGGACRGEGKVDWRGRHFGRVAEKSLL